MKGKIALEEHFAVEDTLGDSLPFVPPDYQAELKHAASISEADREKIGRRNARRLFRLN